MFATLMMLAQLAFGGTLAGVTLPDTATVGGEEVKLVGMGLREKYFIDIYVGGLYLKTPTKDAKRIVMHFIYSDVPADKMRETYDSGFAANADAGSLKAKIDKLNSYMADLTTGDQVVLDYVPGTGTTVSVKGSTKGTIEGADFMKALFAVYLGDSPPTSKLKKGMLGG
jgi:hypothetical protein